MKKIFKIVTRSILAIVGIYVALLMVGIPYFIDTLEAFEPANNKEIIQLYELKGDSPKDYGFNYEEVMFQTKDKLTLSGWYIPAKKESTKCIYFIHGWKSSGLSCFQYLDIVKDKDLDRDHNIFIINLRNSGKSSKTRSDLGYKTSRDVMEGIRFLNNNYGIEKFKIFSVSMGAMATLTALNFYREEIEGMNISIEKVILDSPLSNAKNAIKSFKTSAQILNDLLYIPFFLAVNYRWDDMLDKLRLSYMMTDINVNNILILQSEKDRLTKLSSLKKELENIDVKLEVFKQGAHARIYGSNRERYTNIVYNFFTKEY